MTYPVYHITGCGGVAFSFTVEPYEGMPLDPRLVVYPDGTSPPSDVETKALCGTCMQDLEVRDLTARTPPRT